MKKRYFAPQMEELEVEEPVVLQSQVTSDSETNTNNEEGGGAL